MARFTDIHSNTRITDAPQLPPINWTQIGRTAPTRIPIEPPHPGDPLPAADIVILTWTSSEWSALDYVFLDRPVMLSADELKKDWYPYNRGAGNFKTEKPPALPYPKAAP